MEDTNDSGMTAEKFVGMTIGQLFDMVEQSGEVMFSMTLDGEDGRPFALLSLAIGPPEQIERYGKAIEAQRQSQT